MSQPNGKLGVIYHARLYGRNKLRHSDNSLLNAPWYGLLSRASNCATQEQPERLLIFMGYGASRRLMFNCLPY